MRGEVAGIVDAAVQLPRRADMPLPTSHSLEARPNPAPAVWHSPILDQYRSPPDLQRKPRNAGSSPNRQRITQLISDNIRDGAGAIPASRALRLRQSLLPGRVSE